jgi:adenine-specific DNA-methyltransferase
MMLQLNHETTDALKNALAPLAWAWQGENSLDKTAFSKLLNTHAPTPEEVSKLEALLKILLETPELKAQFFYDIAGTPVFKKEAFLQVILTKEFLPDSYTAYANHIGLKVWGQHLKDIQDVVLDFPYKDCVLEGGQSKDDDKGTEVFYNEVLAPTAISRLKLPKAFNKVEVVGDGNSVEAFNPETHNLMIKGNNYIALNSLLARYRNKVKLIYIDPPYNTGNDSFQYNDNFRHSTWLVFMKNRLELARQLLREDGSIFISIDDDESHYAKLVADLVFGRDHFINNVIWEKKYAPQNDAKWFSDNHDHILVYAKHKETWRPNLLPRTEEMNARYKNPDNDPRGVWKTSDLSVKRVTDKDIYEVVTPSGRKVLPPEGRSWSISKDNFERLVAENRIWFGKNFDSIPQLKRFITDVKDGMTPLTIWNYKDCGHNQDARREVKDVVEGFVFTTPKPEKLLQRIIHLASNENDIVLDYHAGSGTTAAVAHKMNRRWVTIEQLDYIETITKTRLMKVLEGEQGGVSKAVGWQGGGAFIYAELAEDAVTFIKQLENAVTQEQVNVIRRSISEHRAVRLDLKTDGWIRDDAHKFTQTDGSELYFSELPLSHQKALLKQIVDKNKLYILYDNMDDVAYSPLFSETDLAFNRAFYEGGNV